MKIFFQFLWIFSLLFIFSSHSVSADSVDTASQIVEVTVFPDSAMVTRRLQTNLDAGARTLKIASLPSGIEEESIQIKGEGQSAVKLFGVEFMRKQLGEAGSPRVREIQLEIEKLEDQQMALQDQGKVLDQKEKFLNSIQAASSDQIGKDIVTKQPSSADVTQMLALLGTELTALNQQREGLNHQIRETAKEIDKLKRELDQLIASSVKEEGVMLISVEAENAGQVVLDISYRVFGASWETGYEARANTEQSEIGFTTYGIVRQNTGEDWTDVTLHLSTAQPSIGGRMPEIQTWFIRKQEPIVFASAPRAIMKADAMMESASVASGGAYQQATVAQAEVHSKGPAVYYTLPKKETVRSDGQAKKVPILTEILPAALDYEITPSLSLYAYLHAKVKNNTEGLLLAGNVQIFVEGEYIGNSWIDNVAPQEKFDLFLGVDERIKVERKQLKAKADVSVLPGFHGRIKTMDYAYLIKVKNFLPNEVSIVLYDQIPVSQHDEIKIEAVNFDPEPSGQQADKPGVYYWKFKLASQDEQNIKINYRVKHPVDFTVSGL